VFNGVDSRPQTVVPSKTVNHTLKHLSKNPPNNLTMPKDDNSPAVNGEKAPLKRGDACLYCRRRRIRCSANKPQCQNCHKLNRQCEYDTGKPVSRVKQLEEKVAELEGMLKTGPDSPPSSIHQAWSYTTSDSSTSRRDLNQSNGNGNGNGNGFIDMPIDVNMPDSFSSPSGGGGVGNFGNFFPNFGSSMFGGPPSNHQPAPPPTAPTEQKPEDLFDFSTLDPSFMNLVNSFQNTSTGVPDNIQPTLPPQDNDFDAMLNCGSTGLTPFIDANMGGPPSVPPPSGSDYTSPNSAPSQFLPSPPSQSKGPSPSSSNIAYQAYVSDLSDLTEKKANNGLSATGFSFDGADASTQNVIGVSGDHPSAMGQYQHKVGVSGPMDGGLSGNHVDFDPSISGPGMGNKRKKGNGADTPGMEMVGGWFDAADLPRVARNHL